MCKHLGEREYVFAMMSEPHSTFYIFQHAALAATPSPSSPTINLSLSPTSSSTNSPSPTQSPSSAQSLTKEPILVNLAHAIVVAAFAVLG
ncbi:7300_t:CDS:2 [Paraglomus brasilianum]|uniref:7300_t:CDS:1 n=1 Tax=Paraglomus brasilianum TaxID=144538 RepID=A0A9N8ZAS5_9GLOM|nr:7300_t:CDS:2 [Paraglomus brasilianum]